MIRWVGGVHGVDLRVGAGWEKPDANVQTRGDICSFKGEGLGELECRTVSDGINAERNSHASQSCKHLW